MYTNAYDPKEILGLLKSRLGLPSTIVAGLTVSDILFLDGKAFMISVTPSMSDLTISLMILVNGIPLHVDLHLSLMVRTDLSIGPTCSALPYMCTKAGCKRSFRTALSNSLSPWKTLMVKDLPLYLLMILSSAVMIVFNDLEVQYWAVRKLAFSDLEWKKMFPFTKKKSMNKAR